MEKNFSNKVVYYWYAFNLTQIYLAVKLKLKKKIIKKMTKSWKFQDQQQQEEQQSGVIYWAFFQS